MQYLIFLLLWYVLCATQRSITLQHEFLIVGIPNVFADAIRVDRVDRCATEDRAHVHHLGLYFNPGRRVLARTRRLLPQRQRQLLRDRGARLDLLRSSRFNIWVGG